MNEPGFGDVLTPSEAASLLPNTSVDSIRRWIRSGTLRARCQTRAGVAAGLQADFGLTARPRCPLRSCPHVRHVLVVAGRASLRRSEVAQVSAKGLSNPEGCVFPSCDSGRISSRWLAKLAARAPSAGCSSAAEVNAPQPRPAPATSTSSPSNTSSDTSPTPTPSATPHHPTMSSAAHPGQQYAPGKTTMHSGQGNDVLAQPPATARGLGRR